MDDPSTHPSIHQSMMLLCTMTPSPLKNEAAMKKVLPLANSKNILISNRFQLVSEEELKNKTTGWSRVGCKKINPIFSKKQGLSTPPVGVTTLRP